MTSLRSPFSRQFTLFVGVLALPIIVGCATGAEPAGSRQPTPPESSVKSPADVRMMSDAAVKKLFGFIDEAIKREDVIDINWIENALEVKRKPIVEGQAYEYFPITSSALVSRVASGVRDDDTGRLLFQSLQIEILNPRDQCVSVDTMKPHFPEAINDYRSMHFRGTREQPVYVARNKASKIRMVQVTFNFYYQWCLDSIYVYVHPKNSSKGNEK